MVAFNAGWDRETAQRVWQRALQHGLAAIGALLAGSSAAAPSTGHSVCLRLFPRALVRAASPRRNGGVGAGVCVCVAARARGAAATRAASAYPSCDGSIGWLLTHGARAPGRRARRRDLREPRAVVEEPLFLRRARPSHLGNARSGRSTFASPSAPRRAPRPDAPGGRARDASSAAAAAPRRWAGAMGCAGPAGLPLSRRRPRRGLRRLLQPDLRELELLHRDGQPAGAARAFVRREHLHRQRGGGVAAL